jgi:hypothetical protein
VPMQNPSLADVQAAYADYTAKQAEQLRRKSDYDLSQEAVNALRPEVDKFIKKLWNTIEFYFQDDEASSLRRKARAWGVVYKTRPDEEPEPEPQVFTGTVKATEKKEVMKGGFDINTLFIVKNTGTVPLDLYSATDPVDPVPVATVRIQPGIEQEVWATELGADTNPYLICYNSSTTTDGSYQVVVGNPE